MINWSDLLIQLYLDIKKKKIGLISRFDLDSGLHTTDGASM